MEISKPGVKATQATRLKAEIDAQAGKLKLLYSAGEPQRAITAKNRLTRLEKLLEALRRQTEAIKR